MASLVTRGKTYYLQFRVSGRIKRRSLHTNCLQIVKERKRAFESAQFTTRFAIRVDRPRGVQRAAVHARSVA